MKFLTCLLVSCSIVFQGIAQIPDLRSNLNMSRQTQWYKVGEETVIQVCWESTRGYERERALVQEAVESTWQKVAKVRFEDWGQCKSNSKGIRIAVADEAKAPHVTGLGSQLNGKYAGMVLNFTFNNWEPPCQQTRKRCIWNIAVHEFGHALGIAHEQNRTDCNCSETELRGIDGGYYVTPCDKESVMNYCNAKWNNEGQLSYFDKVGIQMIYGARAVADGPTGSISVEDKLGATDQWENVLVELGGQSFSFHLDKNSPSDARSFQVNADGETAYEVWTNTQPASGPMIYGYGKGRVRISASGEVKVTLNGKMQRNGRYALSFKQVGN